MASKKLFFALVVVLVLGLTSIPGIVSAEEGKAGLGAPIGLGASIGPLHPQYLSGGAWLAFTGQDPSGRLFWDRELNDSSPDGRLQAGSGAAALIPYRSPAVKFSRNILISQDRGRLPYQTEPHIAVNPKDPDHIVAAMIDYNFIGVSNYVSIDGGATWDGPFQPQIPRGEIAGVGDPVVAFDREGNVYISQMSVSQQDFLIGGELGSAQVASVVISYSSDGGYTWERTTVASPGLVEGFSIATFPGDRPRGELWTYFVDKPWLTVGPDPDNPEEDILYITYTMFVTRYTLVWMDELAFIAAVGDFSVIELVRSEDGGRSWSFPVAVSPVTDLSGIPGRLVQGSQPAVDSDGTLYVAYWDSTDDGFLEGEAEIWVAASQDRGRTFQNELAATFMELDFYPRVATFRLFGAGFPQLTISPNGELYIAYTAYPEDEPMDGGNAYMVGSLDGGRTWAPPVMVNDDTTGGFQFYPSITVDPEGTLHMMWADTRDDPTGLVYHIYYSSSEDEGKTWEFNSRVSDFPSNPNYAFPNGAFIGDYFSIKATSDDVYMVWPDSRLGEVTGVNQKIAFARKRLMPTPSIFLSPPSGSAGRDITIQGSHFQPESEIFITVGGVLTATGITSQNGTFIITIFAPISGEGARDIVVSDISGNVALASFFTEFGFDTFQQSIGDIETSLDAFEQSITDIETPLGTLQQDIGDIKTRFGTFQQSITDIETSLEREDGFPWLASVLAGALVIALAAVAALWYRLRAVSQD